MTSNFFSHIIAYPLSHKLCSKISNLIVKGVAPRLFRLLKAYKKFNFFGYKELRDKLPEQFIVIANHQSLLDIPVFMNFFSDKDVRFVAKDNLSRHIPLVSEMLRNQEHCMVPRKAKPMEAMAVWTISVPILWWTPPPSPSAFPTARQRS